METVVFPLKNSTDFKPVLFGHKLIPSSYNYVVVEGGQEVFYNLRTRTTLSASGPQAKTLKLVLSGIPVESVSPRLLGLLVRLGFVLPISTPEIDLLRSEYQIALTSSDWLRLIILTTLECNFRCPYCFEKRTHVHMDPKTVEGIIRFVQDNLGGCSGLLVAWFGGEPLLRKQLIRHLTAAFKNTCKTAGKPFRASITTNGYLLDDAFIAELEVLDVMEVQVTFDGLGQAHDATRMLANGRGTFRALQERVERLAATTGTIELLIRVNCTTANIFSVPDLLRSFSNEVRNKARIFFRWVWVNEASGFRDFTPDLNMTESYARLADLYSLAQECGWKTQNPIDSHRIYCEVDSQYTYQIAPDGSIFLCSETYSGSGAIGNVRYRDVGLSIPEGWFECSPFEDPECYGCPVLPICMGGCRMKRWKGKRQCIDEKCEIERFVCVQVRESLRRMGNLVSLP